MHATIATTTNVLKVLATISCLIIAGCATTTPYDDAKRLEKLGQFGDAGDVWIKEAKSKLNSSNPDDRFPDSEFQWAAENFDRDSSRTADALQARKNAASLYLKHAEYYAGKGKYQIASVLSQNAAKIYKHYDTAQKDLNDISSAEQAYLQSNRYQETALLRGEQFSNISTVAWNNLYGLAYLFKGKDASKAKHYATETVSLVKRSPPPLGEVGNYGLITGAGFILEHEGELNSALKAYELGLEYTDITRNTANYKRPIALAEKLGRTDLAKQWGAELVAIEKVEGQTHSGQPWFVANGKSAQELEREAEKRRLQSVAYKSIGQNRLAALRQAMVTDLLTKSRLARNEANERAIRDAELAEQARRDEIEEKARREKSNRDFAMAIGTATAMTSQSQKNNNYKPATYESCTCGPDYIACHERNCRRGNGRCQISRGNGFTSITGYDNQGRKGATHVWYGGNKCGAQAY